MYKIYTTLLLSCLMSVGISQNKTSKTLEKAAVLCSNDCNTPSDWTLTQLENSS